MTIRKQVLGFAALFAPLAVNTPLAAQQFVPSPITWTQHVIQSTTLGTARPYFVALPVGYANSVERYPVLVILDANDQAQFVAALANTQFLAARNEVPGLIVVGVPNGGDRTRELTPAATGETARQAPTAGGADAFLAFLGDELLPAVRRAYRTLPATLLAGHSLGGLFGVHAAATRPGLFVGTIAMSPALYWNDTAVVRRYVDRLARRTEPHRLFVTSSPLEPPIDHATEIFVARLAAAKNSALAVAHQRYLDDTHQLTPLRSFIDGLRFVFQPISLAWADEIDPMQADSARLVAHMAEIEKRYVAGARSLSLPEILPERVLNLWGYLCLQIPRRPRPGVAVAIFRRNVVLHPQSANAHDSLGDGLLALGDTAGARAQFEKAVELAKATGHPVLDVSARKLTRLIGY